MEWLMQGSPLDDPTQMLVSVLIPTRGRPEKLKQAISSVRDTALNPQRIEFLLRVDDDDEATLGVLDTLGPDVKALIGPRGQGYLDIHHHLHAMTQQAKGRWLFVFNDDSIMMTKQWDKFLDVRIVDGDRLEDLGDTGYVWDDDIWLLIPYALGRPESSEFFVVSRHTYNILGHLGNNMGVDQWLEQVFNLIDRKRRVSILIEHNDDVKDKTYQEGRHKVHGALARSLLTDLPVRRERLQDALTLITYIEKFRTQEQGKLFCQKVNNGTVVDYQGRKGLVRFTKLGAS